MNDMNTTAHDGAPCFFCGDDATGVDTVKNLPIATCDDCHHNQVDVCPECDQAFIVRDGVQVNRHLRTCGSCARELVDVALGRHQELLNDERRS